MFGNSFLAALATVSITAVAAVENSFGNCQSTTDAVYELPNTPLRILNKWLAHDADYQALVAAGCPDDRDAGSVCYDKPAIGSGLAQLFPNYFLGLTDRGPNQDCEHLFDVDPVKYADAEGKKGKGFPVKKYAPTIMHFQYDEESRVLNRRRNVPLRGSDGEPITGLPNTAADDTPYGMDCKGEPLGYDPSGLDTEDLARIPGTEYVAIVDEYSPSVVIANYKTGVITARHVPASVGLALSDARYPIAADLPDVYANRRKNRGFEGVVVDAMGKYVIAILQSPMLGEDSSLTENNSIIRCAKFDILMSDNGEPSLKYAMSFAIEASSPDAYTVMANEPKDLKYSAGQYHSPGKFIALERAKGQVKLFLVDYSMATNIDETIYANNLNLEIETNGIYKAAQKGVIPAEKTLVWDSAPGIGGSVDFTGASKQEGFAIDVADDTKVWMMNDNDFGLEGNGNIEMYKISLGRSSGGATVCQLPEHPPSPQIDVNPSKVIKLTNSATYVISDEPGAGAAENLDVDDELMRAYVANNEKGTVDMYNLSTTPVAPMGSYKPGLPYKPSSTSVCRTNGAVAVGLVDDDDDAAPGRVDIFSKEDLTLFRKIKHPHCIQVDHVKYSDDCKFLVAACEGEGATVPGGVMVIDMAGPINERFRGAKVATFKPFDALVRFLRPNGVRLIESQVPSVDFEPEYITIEGNHAFVTLQEANTIAVVDLQEAMITELKPIGFIDRSRAGFALDASDKDDKINIRNYNKLYGMPQPDTIHSYVASDGKTYLVFANEGDSKDDAEEARGEDITDPDELGREVSPALKENVQDKTILGRLKFSFIEGYNASTNTQETMYHFGSRSFSIMALDGTVVFDSGEWFERLLETHLPKIFNANNFDDEDLSKSQEDLFDNRSDDKGMEPESLSLMTKDDMTYAFIGFERGSVIVVFDISDPTEPTFVDLAQNNPTDVPIETLFNEGKQGDLDPEGLFASSKLNKLFVAGSVSNTVSSYDIEM